jgi:hypothetical protein
VKPPTRGLTGVRVLVRRPVDAIDAYRVFGVSGDRSAGFGAGSGRGGGEGSGSRGKLPTPGGKADDPKRHLHMAEADAVTNSK